MRKIKRIACLMLAALTLMSGVSVYADETDESSVNIVGDDMAALNSDVMKDIRKFIETARSHIGVPYNRIGTTPRMGFNDVSFIKYVLHETELGSYEIPNRISMYAACGSIQKTDGGVQPGSIVFFGTNVNDIDHVGIIITQDTMIHVGESGVEEIKISDELKGHIFAYGQVVSLNTVWTQSGRYDDDPRIQG